MELNKLIEIRKLIGIQIQEKDSMNKIGTPEMKLLCDTAIRLDELVIRLQNPEKAKELDKRLNSKLWKD